MQFMADILVLGFQTDTTRITTLKLNNAHSSLRFPNLGVDYMIHHLLSHSDTADWLKVNQFFLEQLPVVLLGGGGGRIKGGAGALIQREARSPDVPALSLDDGQDAVAYEGFRRRGSRRQGCEQ
jgi:hypothetical protein